MEDFGDPLLKFDPALPSENGDDDDDEDVVYLSEDPLTKVSLLSSSSSTPRSSSDLFLRASRKPVFDAPSSKAAVFGSSRSRSRGTTSATSVGYSVRDDPFSAMKSTFTGGELSRKDVADDGMYEMRSRNSRSQNSSGSPPGDSGHGLNPSFVLVDIPIEATDTLPSFAIKYHVTISELKRLNNLFHDQDFYSRQSLRIPIHKYGILAERLVDTSDDTNPPSTAILLDLDSHSATPTDPKSEEVIHENPNTNVRTLMDSLTVTTQSSEAKLFLQNMDRDLTRLTREALQRRPLANQGGGSGGGRVEPLDGLGCDGADLGIPVKVMILMAVVLTVVLPAAFLIYRLYCFNHPDNCPETEKSVHTLRNGSLLTSRDT